MSSRPSDQRPEKPGDDRMCWVDSEAQWAGVGWRNVADVDDDDDDDDERMNFNVA